jgi:hypothetical protein
MKYRLFQALSCSIGVNPYTDCPFDSPTMDGGGNLQQVQASTARDITDALVKKAKDGDTAAVALILQIAEFEPKEQQ